MWREIAERGMKGIGTDGWERRYKKRRENGENMKRKERIDVSKKRMKGIK